MPWSEYFAASLQKPLHPMFATLEPHLGAPGYALDLGCGVGHGALHLARKGWRVDALDASPEALEILTRRLNTPENAALEVNLAMQDMLEFRSPANRYDLIVAVFSLHFVPSDSFQALWDELVGWLRPGGLLMGQLLGSRDDWRALGHPVHTLEDVRRLLAPFDTLFIEEVERDGATIADTPKHWHVFHFVARKKDRID